MRDEPPSSARTARARQQSWEQLKRRLTRRAGQVSPYQERPRLLAAAEEDPDCWDRTLETWPEVARATSRLRPPSTLPSQHEESDAAPPLEDLLPWVREAFGEDFVEAHFPSQAIAPVLRSAPSQITSRPTMRLAQVVQEAVQIAGFKTPPSVSLKAAQPTSLRQNLDRLMSSLQGGQDQRPDWVGVDRQPRTIARQNYDLFRDPFGAADEFTLATKKAERRLNARRNLEGSKEASKEPALTPRRPARETQRRPKSEMVRGRVLERLDYLHTCRGTMGRERFAMERQRLEMQAHLRSAEKYSVEEKPMQVRCAFSAQARGGKVSPWDPDLIQALSRPATAPDPRSTPDKGGLALEASSPSKRAGDSMETGVSVARTFRFASQCAAKKMPMPTLGTFALPAGGEGSPRAAAAHQLSVPNWALGDQLLLALAASPLKDNVAKLEEGDLRGNRISNDGVSAIVANLGPQLAKLDLSANSFDFRGLEAFQSFLPEAGHLTDIDMSSNRLSDRSVSKLCLQLSQHCLQLWRLRLSDVQIGYDIDTGAALGSLVVAVPKIRFLDVSFNLFHGHGAIAFFKGLMASRLRCLDFSWNCLGKGPQCKAVAEEIATAVRAAETLQHLDISFNCLQMQEMGILAKAVRDTNHLWGLHVDGNAGSMDLTGQLTATHAEYLPEDSPRPKTSRSSTKKGKAGKKAQQKSKENADAEISVAGTLLTPAELEARLQALQWQLHIHDLAEEYQKKLDEEEKEQIKEKTRAMTTATGTWSLSLYSKSLYSNGYSKDVEEDNRMPITLPELIRRLPSGQPLSPRSQDEMLQTLALETKPEVGAALKAKTSAHAQGELYLHFGKEGLNSKHSNCWLCNEWVEVEFQVLEDDLLVDVAVPGSEPPDLEVCVLLSVDNFSQPVPLRFEDGCWLGSRFMPPAERIFAIFRMGGQFSVHRRLPVRALQQPFVLALQRTAGQEWDPATVGEINMLRLGSLALAYGCGDANQQAARVLRTASEAATDKAATSPTSRQCSRFF